MEKIKLSDDPKVALEEIGAYLRSISMNMERAVTEKEENGDSYVVGYYQTTEYLVGCLEIAEECERISKKTVAAKWRESGKQDPFGDTYECEREALTLGHLPDDEIANAVFLNGNAGIGSIVYLTAAKERIRWLSRELVKAQQKVAS